MDKMINVGRGYRYEWLFENVSLNCTNMSEKDVDISIKRYKSSTHIIFKKV